MFEESIRLIILLAGPLLIASIVSGILVTFLQSFFRVSEPSLAYGVRLLVIGTTLRIVVPSVIESFQSLLMLCIRN